MKKLISLLLCAACIFSAAPVVSPANAAPLAPTLSLSPAQAPAGATIQLNGAGYTPGGYPGTVLWDGETITTFPIPSGGTFSQPFTVPVDASLGAHTVTVCAGDPCFTWEFEQTASAQLQVVEPPPNSETDFFYGSDGSGEVQVPVQIALDRIGLLAQEDVSTQAVQNFVGQKYHLQLADELADGILVFRLPVSMARMEVVDLARTILAEGANLIAQAGLVLPPSNEDEPIALSSDQFIVQFGADVGASEIDALNAANGVAIIMPNPFQANEYLLQVTPAAGVDAITMANRYHEDPRTEYAHPNFIVPPELRETIPSDPLFGTQWHHRNTGASGGTPDADVDSSEAWDISMGGSDVIIAVIDDGFDMDHPDLVSNYHPSLRWDFRGCDRESAGLGCGDRNPSPGRRRNNHGTAVAGMAAAKGNNGLGVSGSCPDCRIMPIRRGTSRWSDALAIEYAWTSGAHIITNSWGYPLDSVAGVPNVIAAINRAATVGRGGQGAVVFFAMNNGNINDCIYNGYRPPDISSLANVIAISASSNQDRKVTESAFGNCMELLAPTHRGYGPAVLTRTGERVPGVPYVGTLNIVTTDRRGDAGYNNAFPPNDEDGFSSDYCPEESSRRDYTYCFGGTSAATPLSAGIAGLILSERGDLSRQQVQRLLQDTADKVEPGVAAYSPVNGFSSPSAGPATHGYGRINAFEAVRVAAPVADGGRGGVDIFVRDNYLDWGNTEQPSHTLFEPERGYIPHYRSVDIKIDSPVDGYQSVPSPMTSLDFDRLVDETPQSGMSNRVYVRVRNRGPVTAAEVTVKLHWAYAGTGLPALPRDFWDVFPADSTDAAARVHPIGVRTLTNLAYSGSSVAGTPGDAAQIARFDWDAPELDPALPNHYCLFAVIDSLQDLVSDESRLSRIIDHITPNDNNVTHRNVVLSDTGLRRSFAPRFFVRNPFDFAITSVLRLHLDDGSQQNWAIALDPFTPGEPFVLAPGEEVVATLEVTQPQLEQSGTVEVLQEVQGEEETYVLGGMVYEFHPADYSLPDDTPSLLVTPGQGTARQAVMLTGSGFGAEEETASILWDGQLVNTFVMPGSGRFAERIAVPGGAAAGEHTITVCLGDPCRSGGEARQASAPFMVSGEDLPPAQGIYLPLVME